jgi:AI-2 transport protein TqsA
MAEPAVPPLPSETRDAKPAANLAAIADASPAGADMLRTAALLVLAVLALLAAMRLLADVLVPFVLAVFLALLLNPVVDLAVRRFRWPRAVTVGAMFIAATLALLVSLLLLLPLAMDAGQNLPRLTESFGQTLDSTLRTLPLELTPPADVPPTRDVGPQLADADRREAIVADAKDWIYTSLRSLLPAAGGSLFALLTNAGLVLVFLLFLLLGRGETPASPDSLRGQIDRRIQGYLAVTFLISAATGLGTGVVLWLLGVPFAWGFALVAFVLNFIPTIGSAIATLLPMPIVLFGSDLSLPAQIAAFVLPAILQFALGNVVAPKVLGDTLQLSPVAVMLGLILLGAIWGLPGLVLATPMLAVLKIAVERVPLLTPVADVLAGRPIRSSDPA